MKNSFLKKKSGILIGFSVWKFDLRLLPLLGCMLLCMNSFGYSQNEKLTARFRDATIEEVVANLEGLTGYTFVYSDLDQVGVKITAEVTGTDVKALLEGVFKNTPLTFELQDDRVVVLRKDIRKTSPLPVISQQIQMVEIKGRVIDAKKQPVVGANVFVGGTTFGVATDINGEFALRIPATATTLTVTCIGFEKQTVDLRPEMFRTDDNIIELTESVSYMDEVVVQGYGTTRVKDATGAVSRLNSQEIAMSPMGASVQSMLQGRAPGVNVSIQSASPTSPVNVIIRGVSTLTGNTQPLWVIDGVPDYSISSSGDINNTLFNLNLSDVESIDILKDVSATAIYGSRAANGVVIVTTKRGEKGMTPTIDLNIRAGVQTVNSNKVKALDASAYKRFVETVGRQTIEVNGGFDYNTRFFFDETKFNQLMTSQWDGSFLQLKSDAFYEGDTDWWKEMTQNALTQQYDLSIRGGTERSNYFISFSYNDQKGIVKGGRSKLYTGRLNFETLIGKPLKFGLNLSASSRKTNNKDNLLGNVIRFRPDFPAYNEDGSINLVPTNTTIENPNLTLANRNDGLGKIFSGSAFMEWNILDGLKFKSTGTVNYSNTQSDVFSKKGTRGYNASYNTRSLGNYDNTTYVWENTLTWMKDWEKHNLVALLGHSIEKYKSKSLGASGEDFPDEEILINLQSGADSQAESDENGNSLVSVMARLNYKFNQRYLATFTFRADGSSRFGPDSRWGYFPSGALAWVISEEEFMASLRPYIPYLKLRASIGKTGSQNLGNYDYMSLMGAASYEGVPGIRPSSLGNPILQWEETISKDLGLDFGLLNERIRGTLGYYQKKINNLIYDGSVAANSSFETVSQNVGTISNTGWEFDIKADLLKKRDMTLNFGFNIATNTGKVKKLDGIVKELKIPYYYEYVHLEEGGKIGDWYGYKYAGRLFRTQEEIIALKTESGTTGAQQHYRGAYESPGDLYLMDLDGDHKITSKDKTNLGNFNPKFFGGFQLSFNWKNLYASAVFTYSYGAKRLWYYQYEKAYDLGTYNVYNMMFDSYNFVGPDASYPRLAYSNGPGYTVCDMFIHDASYLRMNALNINYRLPQKWYTGTFVNNIELSLAVSNLFTITKYPGFDPQGNFSTEGTSYSAKDVTTVGQGIDRSIYPSARVYNVGVKFSFK